MSRFIAALSALLLAACSLPTTRPPAVDGDRVRAEAELQRQIVSGAEARRHSWRNRDGSPIEADLADLKRIADIGWRVLTGAVLLCGDTTEGQSGALLATIHDIPQPLRKLYHERFQVENEAMVMAVAAGSPAARGGLAVGDLVIAMDDSPRPKSARAASDIEDNMAARSGETIALTVLREGNPLALTVTPVQVCHSRLNLARAGGVNAFADGKKVAIMSGMLRFLDDDDHLATVIGHEIAHNIRGHLRMQAENEQTGATIGNMLDMLTGARELKDHWAGVAGRAFSQTFETEADYVGLYLTAQAGFDVGKAPSLWRRMAVANPQTIAHASSHPTTPSRFVTLEATVKEIDAKRTAGQSLIPEKRKGLF